MARTYTLEVPVKRPDDTPYPGVQVVVTPHPYNYADDGAVISSLTQTTGSDGRVTFNLLPSATGTDYDIRFQDGSGQSIIRPIRFVMLAKDTDIDDLLLQKQMSTVTPPPGTHPATTRIPLPDIVYPVIPDITVQSGCLLYTSPSPRD